MNATCESTHKVPPLFHNEYACGKPAEIHYDGLDLCADCADPKVWALFDIAKQMVTHVINPDNPLGKAVTALAPID